MLKSLCIFNLLLFSFSSYAGISFTACNQYFGDGEDQLITEISDKPIYTIKSGNLQISTITIANHMAILTSDGKSIGEIKDTSRYLGLVDDVENTRIDKNERAIIVTYERLLKTAAYIKLNKVALAFLKSFASTELELKKVEKIKTLVITCEILN